MLPVRLVRATLTALLATVALAPARAQDLADLLPSEVELWVEVSDLDRLSKELAATSLGRLAALVAAEMDPTEIALRLSLPEEALESGVAGGARGFLRGLAIELGLSAERADLLVASLGGALALARLEGEGADDLDGLAFAASLRPGGSLRLAEEVLHGLEGTGDAGRTHGLELVHLAREDDECRAAWSWSAARDLPSGFVVVRPGLIACTFERELAERFLSFDQAEEEDEEPATGRALAAARAANRERGELVLARVAGGRLGRASKDPAARALLATFGLGELAAVELGLGTRDGQLTSRLRIDPRTRRPRPSGDEGERPALRVWRSLDAVPGDTLAVLGIARTPWVTAELTSNLVQHLEGEGPGALLEQLRRNKLLAALRAPGALAEETLVFVRPAGPGIPVFYAAIPATPALDRTFQILGRRGQSEVDLGEGLLFKRRRLSDGQAWILYTQQRGGPRSVLALTRAEDTWIFSDVSAQLQGLLRQRSRERLSVRAEAIARLRAGVAAEVAAAGCTPDDVVAFLHVRAPAVAELLWPYAQLALQVTGALEDPEDLPDAFAVAEKVGNTTVVVLDLADALEVRGRGLLGGLTLLF